jgi:hypothetical protein
MNDSFNILDTQLMRLESGIEESRNNNQIEESKEKDKNSITEKFSSIPNMMKCYICEGKYK